jgi:penicillin-binding protein 1C
VYFVASPIQEFYFKQKSLFYKVLPPYAENCNSEFVIHQIGLIYPKENYKIYVPVDESGQRSKCIFKATHKDPQMSMFWHLDGEYVGTTHKFHQISTLPSPGNHQLVITDEEGETVTCNFFVLDKAGK